MKKVAVLLILLSTLITGCSKNKESNSFERYMEEGKRAVASEEYEVANKFFLLAMEENNKDTEAKALYNQSKNLVEVLKSIEDEKYDVAIQLCDAIEKVSSKSNIIKDVAKSLKEECSTLLEKLKEEAEEEISTRTITYKKTYYLNYLNTIDKNYKDAYDNVVAGAGLRKILEEEYSQWDEALNEILSVLKEQLPSDEMKSLTNSQKSWIKIREEDADLAQEEGGTGTLGLEMRADYLLETTKERCYYLVYDYMR
ncbi:lysozyme inhibitor LprI family protein [Terrisporobacter vanillatitrophus]|uniref:lysozyme inhibitor LprI family protein n=1 Tax=Terrisporobacter vanillatitrophus TaxID=3058402 RepID=UPI003368D7E0